LLVTPLWVVSEQSSFPSEDRSVVEESNWKIPPGNANGSDEWPTGLRWKQRRNL